MLIRYKKTFEKIAMGLLSFMPSEKDLKKLGLDPSLLYDLLKKRFSIIEKEEAYTSFDLPICDSLLLEVCREYCKQVELQWGRASDFTNNSLIHRHMLRDRTSVIEERRQSLIMRKGRE